MAPSFSEIVQSDQFTFYVGSNKDRIVAHSAAIAATSGPMNSLINGRMSEAETRCAELPDIHVDDFIRFCEYAYRGDYTVPSWTEDVPQPVPVEIVSESVPLEEYGFGRLPSTSKKGKKGKKKSSFAQPHLPGWGSPPPPSENPESVLESIPEPELELKPEADMNEQPASAPKLSRHNLRHALQSRDYFDIGNPRTEVSAKFDPVANSSSKQNFAPVFLAHARLYCFANARLVDGLKSLALRKLQQTLLAFKLFKNRIGDVIELARYAYSNDHTQDRTGPEQLDDLRQLVVEYIACEIDVIGDSTEFVRFLEDGGEFAGDFWRLARTYLIR